MTAFFSGRAALIALILTTISCSSDRLLHQGYYDYSNGLLVSARKEFQKAYARGPSFDAAFLIGECTRKLNEEDSVWYERAIERAEVEYARTEIVSTKVRAIRTIALSYYHLGNYEQARPWFDKLTMGASTDPDVYFYLGHCAVELKDYDAALLYLNKYDGLHNDQLRSLIDRCKKRDQ